MMVMFTGKAGLISGIGGVVRVYLAAGSLPVPATVLNPELSLLGGAVARQLVEYAKL